MCNHEVDYLESKREREKNRADTHQYVSPHDEDLPSQTFNEHTL